MKKYKKKNYCYLLEVELFWCIINRIIFAESSKIGEGDT